MEVNAAKNIIQLLRYAMDIVEEAGLADEYNKLYMDIMNCGSGQISAGDVLDKYAQAMPA